MSYIYYLILFLFGLSVGSFLNVVALRYKPSRRVFNSRSLGGRSSCPYCNKQLKWFELIPLISFLIQWGKCRNCGHRISLQYPLVELLSGIIFVAIPFYLHRFYGVLDLFSLDPSLQSFYGFLVVWVLVFLVWLLISIIDSHHYLIPNELNVGLGILGIIIILIKSFSSSWLPSFHSSFLRHYELLFSPFQDVIANHLLGALLGAIFFGILIVVSRGRAMGLGDVKLAFVSGLVLGWPDVGLATLLAFIFGGIWGAFLLLVGKKTMRDKIPFAPIFVLGFVVTVFFGFRIINGYFSLFNI